MKEKQGIKLYAEVMFPVKWKNVFDRFVTFRTTKKCISAEWEKGLVGLIRWVSESSVFWVEENASSGSQEFMLKTFLFEFISTTNMWISMIQISLSLSDIIVLL